MLPAADPLPGPTGMSWVFAKWIKYPCQMFHDSEAAASGEIWFSKNINDALYLGLNHHLNGTLIIDGEIHEGKEYTQ